MHQNRFRFWLGALLWTPLGELWCSPDLLIDWGGDTPFQFLLNIFDVSMSDPVLPRNAMPARYMLWPCVRLSVTSRSSTKMAKPRVMPTVLHSSPGTLVFWCQKSVWNSTGALPSGGAKCRSGRLKSTTFNKQLDISQKRYKIDVQFLLKLNKKPYMLYQMVTLPMTLNAP